MMKRRPIANVIAFRSRGDGVRRRALALQQLQPLGAALLLGQQPQPRASLGDPAVVVAVDQVGRLEARAHATLLSANSTASSGEPTRSIPSISQVCRPNTRRPACSPRAISDRVP